MLGGGTVVITSQVKTVEDLTRALCQARPDLAPRLED
jgi:adenosine/AMP kinase